MKYIHSQAKTEQINNQTRNCKVRKKEKKKKKQTHFQVNMIYIYILYIIVRAKSENNRYRNDGEKYAIYIFVCVCVGQYLIVCYCTQLTQMKGTVFLSLHLVLTYMLREWEITPLSGDNSLIFAVLRWSCTSPDSYLLDLFNAEFFSERY